MNRPALFISILFLLLFQPVVQADERILAFHSDITVNPDSSMQVVETIRVRAEQDQIQRGIYRDFPTSYRDHYGNRYRVEFEIQAVQRDGSNDSYFTQPQSNGIRTYFGSQNVILPPGEYTYTFTYKTSRQLGFFEDHDELYWNVTGNGWVFPIDQASARVFLPEQIASNQVTAEAYTGGQDSTEQAFEQYRTRGGTVFIEASRPLAQYEGLTIVVSWPKGVVAEPTLSEKLVYFYGDNSHLIIGAGGLLLMIIYYLICWRLVGRDPEKGLIITRYEPPDGFSPASLRFIEHMDYDQTCFAVAIINLAVKGHLKITESDGEYTLERTGKDVTMAPGEAALEKKLFGGSKTRVLKQSNHAWIREALEAHEASLRRDYEFNYFVTNSRFFVAGMLLTIAVYIIAIVMMPDLTRVGGGIFMMVWLSIWSVVVFSLIRHAIHAWKRSKGVGAMLAAVHATIFAVIFSGAEVIAIFTFGELISWAMIILIVIGAGINWAFYELLKAPTLVGRNLLDRIEGFRHYIEIAEKQELAIRHPMGRNPELFESYLPYALALGVEQQWAQKFSDVLTKVSAAGTTPYHPVWYSGAGWDNNHIGDFSSSLGSGFTSAIAAASTAPGSSGGSGGGGGGSSGGGGGGGGGGGW